METLVFLVIYATPLSFEGNVFLTLLFSYRAPELGHNWSRFEENPASLLTAYRRLDNVDVWVTLGY